MNMFAKTTEAPKPKTKNAQSAAYMYAGLLTVFAVSQLFKFEEFIEIIQSFGFVGSDSGAHLFASLIVVAEVFALPFLLGLRLSPAMRLGSMVMGWLVPALWLYLSFVANFVEGSIENFGFFGAMVTLVPGWWAIFMSAALANLAAWASWGMWPLKPKKGKKEKK